MYTYIWTLRAADRPLGQPDSSIIIIIISSMFIIMCIPLIIIVTITISINIRIDPVEWLAEHCRDSTGWNLEFDETAPLCSSRVRQLI